MSDQSSVVAALTKLVDDETLSGTGKVLVAVAFGLAEVLDLPSDMLEARDRAATAKELRSLIKDLKGQSAPGGGEGGATTGPFGSDEPELGDST